MARGKDPGDNERVLHIEPVRRTRAYEDVVRQLQDLMQKELLRPGDRLPSERELAQRFRVSRVTVRQALSVLQAMGLIDSRVGDGTFARSDGQSLTVTVLASVLRSPPGRLGEQLELRRLLEPQVARLAAERATEADLREMRDHLVQQRERHGSGQAFVDEDIRFHLAIARATQNALLVRMIESIHELLRGSRERSLGTPAGRERSLRWHGTIEAAIVAGDSEAASDAMLGHLLDVEGLVMRAEAGGVGGAGKDGHCTKTGES